MFLVWGTRTTNPSNFFLQIVQSLSLDSYIFPRERFRWKSLVARWLHIVHGIGCNVLYPTCHKLMCTIYFSLSFGLNVFRLVSACLQPRLHILAAGTPECDLTRIYGDVVTSKIPNKVTKYKFPMYLFQYCHVVWILRSPIEEKKCNNKIVRTEIELTDHKLERLDLSGFYYTKMCRECQNWFKTGWIGDMKS